MAPDWERIINFCQTQFQLITQFKYFYHIFWKKSTMWNFVNKLKNQQYHVKVHLLHKKTAFGNKWRQIENNSTNWNRTWIQISFGLKQKEYANLSMLICWLRAKIDFWMRKSAFDKKWLAMRKV